MTQFIHDPVTPGLYACRFFLSLETFYYAIIIKTQIFHRMSYKATFMLKSFWHIHLWIDLMKNCVNAGTMMIQIFHKIRYNPNCSLLYHWEVLGFFYYQTILTNYNLDLRSYGQLLFLFLNESIKQSRLTYA